MTQAEIIYGVLKDHPYNTVAELEKICDVPRPALYKRLPELRKKGLAYKTRSRICTVTGKRAGVWYV